jgi:hypothetical protein
MQIDKAQLLQFLRYKGQHYQPTRPSSNPIKS